MPFDTLVSDVLDQDLCARCGLCAAVCPAQALDVSDLVPQLKTGLDTSICGNCTLCAQVCPGADPATPSIEQGQFGQVRSESQRWLGIFRSAWGGRASDEETFARSGSGGATTVLLRAAKALLGLDDLLVAGRDPDKRWRARPQWCSEPHELSGFSQSTYQLSAYLAALGPILQAPVEPGKPPPRVGLVGLACHIQALRKLQALDHPMGERARERVLFLIEIACSSSTLPEGTESLVRDVMGQSLAQVADVRYRDRGYPGEFAVYTDDGQRHALPVWRAIRHFKDYKSHRCLSCGDWLSGLADVSIFDGDPDIFRSSQVNDGAFSKHGSILVRTEVGLRVFEHALSSGELAAWSKEIVETGNLGLTRKRNRRASYERSSRPIPQGPIPGMIEEFDIVPDESLVPLPSTETT